jgi:calcium-dependent protein kinase
MKNEDFRKYYEINKGRIGEGWLSVVYKAKNKKTNEKKAIKVLNINKLRYNFNKCNLRDANDNDVKSFINDFIKETENMKLIEGENKDNKNTVKFDECFMTDKELSIVMELCDDNLMNFLIERKTSFNSNEIYGILSQLNNTFQLLVKKKLVHRDLKLENILVKYENKEKTKYILKLSDYEVTKKLRTFTEKCTKRVGTLKYMAPEILQGHEYGRECDLWSLGVIIYTLFFKEFPFDGETDEVLIKQINYINDNHLIKKTGNKDLDDLIGKLLIKDPIKRISWKQYFNHPFFKNSKCIL